MCFCSANLHMRKPYNWALNDEGGIFLFRTGLHEYASTENMEFFTYINNRLRNLRKLPTKHKGDHSTLMRVRKCKVSKSDLTSNIKLKSQRS